MKRRGACVCVCVCVCVCGCWWITALLVLLSQPDQSAIHTALWRREGESEEGTIIRVGSDHCYKCAVKTSALSIRMVIALAER